MIINNNVSSLIGSTVLKEDSSANIKTKGENEGEKLSVRSSEVTRETDPGFETSRRSEIVAENIAAANNSIDDLESAIELTSNVKSQIVEDSETAKMAQGNLAPSKVFDLLS